MGFTENAAKRALMANNMDPNAAVMWIFEHGQDADLNDPIPDPADQADDSK